MSAHRYISSPSVFTPWVCLSLQRSGSNNGSLSFAAAASAASVVSHRRMAASPERFEAIMEHREKSLIIRKSPP